MAHAGYTTVRMLQRFESISKYWHEDETRFKSGVVLSPWDGIKVGFWETNVG